jgi:hypothetical protein
MAKTATKKPRAKAAPKAAPQVAPEEPAETPKYASFKLQNRIKPVRVAGPNAFRLFGRALGLLGRHWKLFGGMLLIYGILNFVVLQGFRAAGGDLTSLKDALEGDVNVNQLAGSLTLFAYLISTSGATVSPTAGAYQFILAIVVSLALIWTLRQVYAKVKVRIRDGFYKGAYPLVPFVVVLFVICIQLLPLAIGVLLFNSVMNYGIAATIVEQILWSILCVLLGTVSLYLVCSSIFALYIVCLPDMEPMRALRSARELVRGRRSQVMRKLLFLPVALLVLVAVITIPFILFATSLAVPVFFLLGLLLPAVIHSYMYGLYRSLL